MYTYTWHINKHCIYRWSMWKTITWLITDNTGSMWTPRMKQVLWEIQIARDFAWIFLCSNGALLGRPFVREWMLKDLKVKCLGPNSKALPSKSWWTSRCASPWSKGATWRQSRCHSMSWVIENHCRSFPNLQSSKIKASDCQIFFGDLAAGNDCLSFQETF